MVGMNLDNKTFKTFLITISCLLIIILSLLLTSDLKKEYLTKKDIDSVNNINMFYVVESCVNKYIQYLSIKDYAVIYEILDDNYIDKNKVTLDNIDEHIDTLDSNYTLSITNMYKHKNMDIYYVQGTLIKETLYETNGKNKEFKTTIKLDRKNNKFSVIPDGDGGVLDD